MGHERASKRARDASKGSEHGKRAREASKGSGHPFFLAVLTGLFLCE